MAVISVRLNAAEQRMLEELTEMLELDTSALVKRSLREMYEDALDRAVITRFEEREVRGEVRYIPDSEVWGTAAEEA